jgi:hypothetical protein
MKVRFIYEICLAEVEKFSTILTGPNLVFLTVLQQNLPKCMFTLHVFAMLQLSHAYVTTLIQRIHSLAHCSEINAMKMTNQILIMISGVCETSLINKYVYRLPL